MSPLKAALLASVERYFGFIAAFVTSIVISRLLTPAEVGTFSVAMAITGIASVIREFGAASFLIRAPTIDERHESCAFGLSLLLGWSLGSLLLIAAPFIGPLFNNDAVTPVLQLLCMNFFVVPFGTVQSSLLQRSMRFDVLTIIGIASTIVSMTISITLAWLGHGAYALAIGAVSLTTTASVLSILLGPLPKLRLPRLKGARDLLNFGLQSTCLSMILEVNARSPDFIIGYVGGMHPAGLLSRASSLASNVNDLLMKGIGTIALPYLSKIQRDTGDASNTHLRMASIVTALGIPLFATLAYLAPDITVLLYGEKWLEITTTLQLLCLMYCLTLPFSFQFQLVIAKGQLATQLKTSALIFPLRILVVTTSAYIGGLNGMALGLVVCQLISLTIASFKIWPTIGVTWHKYFMVIHENIPSILSVLITTALFELMKHIGLSSTYIAIFYPLLLGTLTIGFLLMFRHPIISQVKTIIAKRN